MTNPDRLAEIEARMRIAAEPSERQFYFNVHAAMDLSWLVSEVERLRGLLREIEWTTNGSSGPPDFIPICPACRGYKGHGHRKDCWLAAEI